MNVWIFANRPIRMRLWSPRFQPSFSSEIDKRLRVSSPALLNVAEVAQGLSGLFEGWFQIEGPAEIRACFVELSSSLEKDAVAGVRKRIVNTHR